MQTIDVELQLNKSPIETTLELSSKQIDLTITGYVGPQGPQGIQGPQGPAGADGDGALAIAYAVALG